MTTQLITAAKALIANSCSSMLELSPSVHTDVLTKDLEALRAAINAAENPEPICYISGIHAGRFIVQPTNPAIALIPGMELFAAPVSQSPSKAHTPLTGEQLRDIARGYKANDQHHMRDHWDLFVDFARSVEAAHGITGDTK